MLVKIAKFGLLAAVAALGSAVLAGPALALNLNTHGVVFQPYATAAANSVEYVTTGVRPVSGQSTTVIGAVPRSGISGTTQTIFLDGTNPSGLCSTVTFTSYSASGTLQSAIGGNGCGTYALNKTLTVSSTSYINVLSTIPNGGVIRGVTAVQ